MLEYITTHAMCIPLKDLLWNCAGLIKSYFVPVSNTVVDIAAGATVGPLISLKRGLEASATRKTMPSVEWSRNGRSSATVPVRENYDKSSDNSTVPSAIPKKRRCSRKLKHDEVGPFAQVVGRSDQDDITSPISLSGFVVAVQGGGGHRIYWSGRKVAYELPANEDKGLDALVKLGFLIIGIIYLSCCLKCNV